MMVAGLLAAAVIAGAPAPQAGPPPPPPATQARPAPLLPASGDQSDPTELSEVVVQGQRARETAARFIDRIGAPASSRRLARWPNTVCVAVANLSTASARYLVDRVSQVAFELGLQVGEPGCTANVVIVATVDAPAVATALVEEHLKAFRPGGTGMTRTLRQLEEFKTSDRPVRWWHVSVPVDSETGAAAVRLPGEEAPVINVSRASRLRSDIRDDLGKAIIVIDVDRLGATTFEQLADYVSLVALAQIDAAAPTSDIPTVLNVFEDPESTPGFTSWDLAYLHALYQAEPNRARVGAQAADIAGLMVRARRDQETD
jgi:hypothetical protein